MRKENTDTILLDDGAFLDFMLDIEKNALAEIEKEQKRKETDAKKKTNSTRRK